MEDNNEKHQEEINKHLQKWFKDQSDVNLEKVWVCKSDTMFDDLISRIEKNNLLALKIGFKMNEWEDFLLVLNSVRQRDKDLIDMYRKKYIDTISLKHELSKITKQLDNLSRVHGRVSKVFHPHKSSISFKYEDGSVYRVSINKSETVTAEF